MQYFGEPEGRIKIQMMSSKNLHRYYILKCPIRRFHFPKILTCQLRFLIFRAVGGMRRVQISCDICIRFARYLYFTKQCWIIKCFTGHVSLVNSRKFKSRMSQIDYGFEIYVFNIE